MTAMDDVDVIKRLQSIDHPLGGMWYVSFAELRESDTTLSSGYNATDQPGGDDTVTTDVTEVVLDTKSPPTTGTGSPGYAEPDMSLMNGTPWEGVLVVEGIETGDGREFAPNAITWADTPLPLRHNIEDSHGGMPTTTTVLVGRIDEVWRNPEQPLEIRGRGVFDDNGAHGAEALRLVRGGFLRGVSVDPDDIKDADVELIFPDEGDGGPIDELDSLFMMPEKTVFHAGRLRAATLCDIPAFVEAQIQLTDQAQVQEAVAAAAAGHFGELSDRAWNGAVAEQRLAPHLTLKMARAAYAHVGDGAKTSTRFLHHHIIEADEPGADRVHIGAANLTACSVGIRAINAGRAAALTEKERRAAYTHMAEHLRVAGLVPPPYEDPGAVLAAGAFEHLVRPPREWFENPGFDRLTPLTVTDEGRVFGHGAGWTECHTAFPGVCTTAPPEGEHSYFRLGEVVTADGGRVAVGHITLGTGHAPTRGITSSQAAEHYDHTGTVVAVVASGEDDHGIWVAGAVRPGVSEARVQELRAAPLSGDWRRIGGKLRLVAFLAVNRPGFPVPRLKTHVRSGQQYSLVAAGIVTQEMRHVGGDSAAVSAALTRIARGIGRDPATRMSELRKRVRGE